MTQKPVYAGKYVHTIIDACLSSVVSKSHMALLSQPGWGKTELLDKIAQEMTPDTLFMQFDSSTPPEVVTGIYDPEGLISSPVQLRRILTGTPYQPGLKICIPDELFRGMDVTFDPFLHAMKPRVGVEMPVFWATSNFAPPQERSKALVDRFAMWVWPTLTMSATEVAESHMRNGGSLSLPVTLPTWSEVEKVRAMRPGNKAIKAVVEIIEELERECGEENVEINPRRVTQWQAVLFYTSALYYDSDDFESCHQKATEALQWCYPALKKSDSARWVEISRGVGDAIGAALNELMRISMDKIKALVQAKGGTSSAVAVELGKMISDCKRELTSLGTKDPRVSDGIAQLEAVFQDVVRGEDPFKGK